MDVDVSEEEQLLLISAVQSARGTITQASPTHSFGIPQETPVDYSVSEQEVASVSNNCLPLSTLWYLCYTSILYSCREHCT